MKIQVKFADALLTKFQQGTGELLFNINWEHQDVHYPMKDWSDFGLVILGWWISTIVKLHQGQDRGDFLFMDGPYAITAQYNRETDEIKLFPHGLPVTWSIQFDQLIQEIKGIIKQINDELEARKIGEKERFILQKYAIIIEECLLKKESVYHRLAMV